VTAETSIEPLVLAAIILKVPGVDEEFVIARSPVYLGPAELLPNSLESVADNTAPLDIVISRRPRLPVNIPELLKAPVLVPDTVIPLRSALSVDEISVTATLPAPLIVKPFACAALRVKVPAVTSTLLPLLRELMAEPEEAEALDALLPSPVPCPPVPL
jgi:hypothetical protein